FRDEPRFGLDQSFGYGLCGWATDWDGDGDQDLFVCGTDFLYYLRNDDGVFTSHGQEIGIGRAYGHCETADVDDDGDIDIVGERSGEVAYHANQGDGTFAASTIIDTVSNNVGSAVADANGDNYPDIFVVRGAPPSAQVVNPRDFLYLNPGADQTADWTRVAMPTTTGSGTDAVAITVLPGERPRFLVGNGNFNLLGPVQLLSLVPNEAQ
ncbi:MAG TPA: VCBS repeat-containing protein, partial [Actinomycetes bacterium]|nr:VCBS repeat-containing protein [Actinomycetes bacterium]